MVDIAWRAVRSGILHAVGLPSLFQIVASCRAGAPRIRAQGWCTVSARELRAVNIYLRAP